MAKRSLDLGMVVFLLLLVLLIGSTRSEAAELEIRVNAGGHYTHHYRWGILNLRLIPQMAFWLEDEKGHFLANIYITYRSATSQWVGGRKVRRPAALPVWSHQQGIQYQDGLYMPDREHPLPDAVTGATPKNSFARELSLPKGLPPGKYVIKAEVNSSFDYNEKYQKDLSESDPDFNAENGQPSVIWKGGLVFGSKRTKVALSPCGHGEPMGKDGKINTDMNGITDASQIVESIEAEYTPGK